MRRFVMLGLLVLAGLSLPACQNKVSDLDLEPVNYTQLRKLLDEPKNMVVLVDVRPARKFNVEHIQGAVNIPLPEITEGDARLADARTIVVYAGGFQDVLGPAGAKILMTRGYKNVMDFRGGLEEWRGQGGATVKAPPTSVPEKPKP